MRLKKQIKNDILKILQDSEVPKELWSKVLTRLVNYAYLKAKLNTIFEGDPEWKQ